jgi:hypothetical protein
LYAINVLLPGGFSAAAASEYMHVFAAPDTIKHPGDEGFVVPQRGPADRTFPAALSPQAVGTAPDVHNLIFASGRRGKGCRLYQFTFI